MPTQISNYKVFSKIGIITIIFLIAVAAGVGYVVARQNNDKTNEQSVARYKPIGKPSAKVAKPQSASPTLATTYTDPDKHEIAVLLAKECGPGGEQALIDIASDPEKFVVRGGFARVKVACEGGGFIGYVGKGLGGVDTWSVIEKTQQTPNCKNFDNTAGLSRDIVTTCYDENTMQERTVQ